MKQKKSIPERIRSPDPRLLAKEVGFGVTETVWHKTTDGKFVNLQTNEVRSRSDFTKTGDLKITLKDGNQQ